MTNGIVGGRQGLIGLIVGVLGMVLVAHGPAGATDRDARGILKAMSDYMVSQKTLSLTFDSDIEVITPQLEKIQFTNSGELMMSRPDKLRAHRVGGYSDVELVFDGAKASVFSKALNAFVQVDAKGTIDQLIDALRRGRGVALPFADYLNSHPYDTLIAEVMEAKHIGIGVIDGVVCEHLAFRNHDTDWQIWIETGAKPFPRKVVITSKTIGGAPQYTMRIKSWKVGFEPAADAFAFTAPKNAAVLGPDDFIKLDELPEGAPSK